MGESASFLGGVALKAWGSVGGLQGTQLLTSNFIVSNFHVFSREFAQVHTGQAVGILFLYCVFSVNVLMALRSK